MVKGFKGMLNKVKDLVMIFTNKRIEPYLDKKRVRGKDELTNQEIVIFAKRYVVI